MGSRNQQLPMTPYGRFQEEVKAVAREAGLQITEFRSGGDNTRLNLVYSGGKILLNIKVNWRGVYLYGVWKGKKFERWNKNQLRNYLHDMSHPGAEQKSA
jgi:hypothetical protein